MSSPSRIGPPRLHRLHNGPCRSALARSAPASRVAAALALTAALLTAAGAPANARETAAASAGKSPDGKIIVFVTEGAQVSWVGTELKEFPASAACRPLPPGAHVVSNHSDGRLLFFTDPFCMAPVPPPFNFIPPGHGAHVSPTGGFRVG